MVWITVPGEIWITHDLAATVPRRSWKKGPTYTPSLSRIERVIARREGRISADF